VRLSVERRLCEEILTNDDVRGGKASVMVQSRQQARLRQQITPPVDGKQSHSIVQPDMAVTNEFTIATNQITLMKKRILNGT
jgi:hypothetical protein